MLRQEDFLTDLTVSLLHVAWIHSAQTNLRQAVFHKFDTGRACKETEITLDNFA